MIDEQGLQTRRAAARDRPRLGAVDGLIPRLNEDHGTLRDSNLAIREPRPTKEGALLAPKLITDYFCGSSEMSLLTSRLPFSL
jgi:hypothetical protein